MRIERGENWELRLGQWQDSPPDEVDHVIADPPYDLETHEGARRQGDGVEILEIPFDALKAADVCGIARLWPKIATRWCLAFCAVEQLGDYRRANRDAYVRAGFYIKTNPTPQFTGDRPATPGEGIAIMHRPPPGRKVWNGGGKAAIWYAARGYQKRADKHHPTEKPLPLMRQLVADFTDRGDLIWDPYAGSATTGVAALQLGRRFIGHEINEAYFERACERLERAAAAPELSFAPSLDGKQSTMFED